MSSQWWFDQKYYPEMLYSFEQSPYGLSQSPYGLAIGARKNPVEMVLADKRGFELAMRNIRTDPKAYLFSRMKSWPYLFISSFSGPPWRERWERGYYLRLIFKLFMLSVFSIGPIALGFLNLQRVRENPATALCAAVWIFTIVVHLPLWIEPRFWTPAFPFLVICAFAARIAPTAPVKPKEQNNSHAG
jgi:hypothetical protein